MTTEREEFKQQLNNELASIQFTGHDRVIRQTHPPTLRSRLLAFWNKEIELPVKLVGGVSASLLVVFLLLNLLYVGAPQQNSQQQQGLRELIEVGGNTYWKDIYEQAVKQHDN
ncbi:hypothetical protein H1230_26590 [Paenibacillus sp. 19GGS1-52]|uniref:hypothetical protein n=1 Tax=Paenibacillus sp. 19GGS1-52 TaxID=2758563 RepID=UPI001EFBE2DA|nr:hypothetical protein [Paenibacillus sp. 19GGS1-52]ULO06532.1 hypothetical protein H1230_26590 [Paenibacillus sp. 19GGS1-52]